MKKNYNMPATEVVAFVGESMIMAGSPTNTLDPNQEPIPGGGTGEG